MSLGGLTATVTQPNTTCTNTLSVSKITATPAGASGSVVANGSCPVVASSNQSWLTVTPLGTTVYYTISPNNGTTSRTATLTIDSMTIPVTQSVNPGLNCEVTGDASVSVADVQKVILEATGASYPVNDLNDDGVVDVADVQIVIAAAVGYGCSAAQ